MYVAAIALLLMGVGQCLIVLGDTPNVIIAGLGFIIIGGVIAIVDVMADKKTGPK